jgi:polysaccharide biosynthesis/export protein
VLTLQGNVYYPGDYGWSHGMRLSQLLARAGGLQPATFAGRAHIERLRLPDSTRYLVTAELPADSTGAWVDDVELQQYDVVTIFNRADFRRDRTVTIAGMVNQPGEYPYREGMTILDLVLVAHGVRDGAFLDTAEVARLPRDRSSGALAEIVRTPLDARLLLEPQSSSYPQLTSRSTATAQSGSLLALQPFDHVLILKQPGFELQRKVQIQGEVRFPGSYALQRKDERVSDLVRRAGGLLPAGNADGGQFVRSLDSAGRVDVRLREALRSPGGKDDIVLQPGDLLTVPEYSPVVKVEGAVNSPVSILYKEGEGLSYYIANAGGYARNADRRGVHVKYANGSADVRRTKMLLFHASPQPKPGSTITVPALAGNGGTDWEGALLKIGRIVTMIGTVIVVWTRAT